MSHLEITKIVLVCCNIVNNDCQKYLIVLHKFIPNKSFGQLLGIAPRNLIS